MNEISFKVIGGMTHYNCGCITKVVGENFFINPCSPDCEVLDYVLEESKKKGNEITIRVAGDHR